MYLRLLILWCVAAVTANSGTVSLNPPPRAEGDYAVARESCPDPAAIAPCVCWADVSGLILDCSAIVTETELSQALAAPLPTPEFHALIIAHNHDPSQNLLTLEGDTLGAATFRQVNISGSWLQSVDSDTFMGSSLTLQLWSLTNNRVSYFPFASLRLYEALHTVELDDNRLTDLPALHSDNLLHLSLSGNLDIQLAPDAFTQTPGLRELLLVNIGLEVLPSGLFTPLERLAVLDLSDNLQTSLDVGAIILPNASLTDLTIDRNLISFVRHDSLVGLRGDGTLRMRSNDLTELPQDSWQQVFNQLLPYGVVDLADNELACGCDLAWIMLDPEDRYRPLLTDTTTCATGEMVIFLDPNIFCVYCEGYECP